MEKFKKHWKVYVALVAIVLSGGSGFYAGRHGRPTVVQQITEHKSDTKIAVQADTKVDTHSDQKVTAKNDSNLVKDITKTHTKVTKKDGTVIEVTTENEHVGAQTHNESQTNTTVAQQVETHTVATEQVHEESRTETKISYAPKYTISFMVLTEPAKVFDLNLDGLKDTVRVGGVFQWNNVVGPFNAGFVVLVPPANIKETMGGVVVGLSF